MYERIIAYFNFDKPPKLTLSKILAFLLGMANTYLLFVTWFSDLDSVKKTIIFIVVLAMTLVRFGFWIARAMKINQSIDIKNERERLQNWREKLELREKDIKFKSKNN